MRFALTVCSLVCLSSALVAQSNPVSTDLTAVISRSCPVSASAERGAPGAVVQTTKGSAPGGGNKLYLHFAPADARSIVAVTITLHGRDASPHAELAADSPSEVRTETFHLTSGNAGTLRSAEVVPKRIANVRWVAITELRFGDGTTWQASEQAFCHIEPNGFRLVAASR